MRPATGVPPWEITDAFAADSPAGASEASEASEASGAGRGTGPAAPAAPVPSRGQGSGTGAPADSTESFPAVDPGTERAQFPQASAGTGPADSTESFPVVRPRPDYEDAFRLFPPMRESGNRPRDSGGQD